MKKLVLIATLLLAGTAAQAQNKSQEPAAWQVQLQEYQDSLTSASVTGLYVRTGWYAAKATATCTAAVAVTGATFVADTAPLTNVIAEGLANIANSDYQTYQNILSWENLANIGRGTLGGGVVGVAESLEFVVLWLGGNEAQSYEALAKNYASTIATANAMFADQGQCLMSISKVMLTRNELNKRSLLPSPMRVPDAQLIQP